MTLRTGRSAPAMLGPRLWLVLAWMAIIFLLSAQPGTESASLSEAVARVLARCICGIAQALGMDHDFFSIPAITVMLHPLVRKAAHATEYAILAILLARWLEAWLPGGRRVLVLALGTACLYAVLDEAHQLLVAGRAGQRLDVAIDALGAALGLLLRCLVKRHRESCPPR